MHYHEFSDSVIVSGETLLVVLKFDELVKAEGFKEVKSKSQFYELNK